jgi:Methyltransferase domain
MSMDLQTFSDRLMNASFGTILRKAGLIQPGPRDPNMRGIPEVPLKDIVRSNPMIRVDGSYTYVDGSLPWCDITAVLSIVIDRRPRSVVEIGTLHGHTTRLLAINLPDATINTIDLPPDPNLNQSPLPADDFHLILSRRLGEMFVSDPSITNVTQLLGDTATMQFPEADLFYIDGSHTYEYVKNDTQKALASSKTKTIIWHDCDDSHPGVTRWLREMADNGLPVKRIRDTNLAVLCL